MTRLLKNSILATVLIFSGLLQAQEFKQLDKSPLDVSAFPTSNRETNKIVKIVYSRPTLKNRSITDLAPLDKVWRTGANESAEITFYQDVSLGNTLIEAGTYSFFTIPGETEWHAIINSDLNAWGAYTYNEANDVARLTVPVSTSEESLEAFSIAFSESDSTLNMHLGWDKIRVAVPFTIKK